jgi:hypothetical protein
MSHLVHRLELEIRAADSSEARLLQERLSRLHHGTIAALLEQVFDQLSPAGTHHRLDTLELDLGELAADQLEHQFPRQLERALRRALPSRLRLSQLRADRPGDPSTPREARSASIPAVPGSQTRPAVDRPPPTSDSAVGQPTGAEPSLPPVPAPPEASEAARDLELLAWFASTGTLPWWAPRQEARLIPVILARALGLPPRTLAPLLRQLAAAPPARTRLLAACALDQRPPLLQALASQAAADADVPSPESPEEAPATANADIDKDTDADPPEPGAHPLAPPTSQTALDPAPRAGPALAAPGLPSNLHRGEGLPVEGAGLVLLWPFLATLFARLGWLTPQRRFVDAPAQQRALALLGYLVDGDPEPPEWHLPLAKLLCGLPLDAVFALEEDLSAAELAEAERLLQAVLAHGDGQLGDEVASLRASWLQRPGLLRWRPQAWLLVVQQRDELDGALERLPWGVSLLRLPWMAELVQVAWRQHGP